MGATLLLVLLAGWWGLAVGTSSGRYVCAHMLCAWKTAAEAVGRCVQQVCTWCHGLCINPTGSSNLEFAD